MYTAKVGYLQNCEIRYRMPGHLRSVGPRLLFYALQQNFYSSSFLSRRDKEKVGLWPLEKHQAYQEDLCQCVGSTTQLTIILSLKQINIITLLNRPTISISVTQTLHRTNHLQQINTISLQASLNCLIHLLNLAVAPTKIGLNTQFRPRRFKQ